MSFAYYSELTVSVWRQLFRSAWNDFKARFDGILDNFSRHRKLIESQFLLLQASHHKNDTAAMGSKLDEMLKNLAAAKSLIEKDETRRKTERLSAIQEWIGGSHPGVIHEMLLNVRNEYPSTGKWVENQATVSSWINDDLPRSSALWMHGMPGAGKFCHYRDENWN